MSFLYFTLNKNTDHLLCSMPSTSQGLPLLIRTMVLQGPAVTVPSDGAGSEAQRVYRLVPRGDIPGMWQSWELNPEPCS